MSVICLVRLNLQKAALEEHACEAKRIIDELTRLDERSPGFSVTFPLTA